MVTRLYITNSAPTYTPATVRTSSVNSSTAMVSRALAAAKSGTNTTVAQAETSTTNNRRHVLLRGISEPLVAGGNSGGNMTLSIAALESNTAANMNTLLTVYATSGDSDTVRGTLFATAVGATEWASSTTIVSYSVSLSTVALQAGDRIVVELGYNAANTSSTSYTGTLRYGGTAADLATSGTTGVTANSPWVEFSAMDSLFTAPKPKIETLTDDFAADNRATKWPDSYGTTAVSGGVGSVTSDATNQYSGLQTSTTAANQYSLVDSYMKVKMNLPAGSTGEYGEVMAMPLPADGTDIDVSWQSGTLTMGIRSAYSFTSSGTLAVAGGSSIWVGIAEGTGRSHFGTAGTAGNLYFYTSTDGINWTQRHTVASPAYVNSITAILATGRDTSGTITVTFDDFNITPATGFSGDITITRTTALSLSGAATMFTDSLALSASRTLTLTQQPEDIVFRQPVNTTNVDTSAVTATVAIPETARVGDALFYIYTTRSLSSAEHSTPSGFTQLLGATSATRGSMRVGWRPVVSGDLGTSLTFTSTNLAAVDGNVTLMCVGGVDTTNLLAHSEAPGAGAGAGTQFSFPTRTPTVENASYLYIGGFWNPTSAVSQSAKSSSIGHVEQSNAGAANDLGTYIAAEQAFTTTAYAARVFQVNVASTNSVTTTFVLRPKPQGRATPGTSERYYDMSTAVASVNAATSISEINDALNLVEVAYGTDLGVVVSGTSFGTRTWELPTIDDVNLKPAVISTLDALAKYPPDVIKAIGVQDMFLVKNITNAEKPEADIGGFANNAQLFLDIDNNTTSLSFGYLFHHELDHVIANVLTQYREYFENEWVALNPAGFAYMGNSYTDAFTGDWPEGFVRNYARYSFAEDMAETHAMMFSTSKQALLAEMVAEDPIIAAKVALMKRWLSDHSWGWISGDTYYSQINIPTESNYSGSLTLTRTTAVTLAGSPAMANSLSRSLTPAVTVAGSPAMSNSLSRSLTAATTVAGTPSVTATLSQSLNTALTPAGSPSAGSNLNLAVTRALTTAGNPHTVAALSLVSNRSITLDGSPSAVGSLDLATTRSLITPGTPAMPGTLSRSLTPSTSAVGIPTPAEALSRALTPALTLDYAFNISGSLVRALTTAVTVSGTPAITSTLSLPRTISLTFSATIATFGTVTMTGTTSLLLTGEGFSQGSGSINLAVTRALTLDGTPAMPGTLSLSASRQLTLNGSPSASGNLNLSASRSLAEAGTPSPVSALLRAVTLSLGLDGNPAMASSLSVSRVLSLILNGTPATSDSLDLALATSLVLAGSTDGTGTLNLAVDASLSLSGTPNIVENMILLGDTTLSAAGSPAVSDSLARSLARSLDVAGSPSFSGGLSLSATRSVSGGGTPAISGNLPVDRTRVLSLAATAIAVAGTLNLSGTRALVLEGIGTAEGMGTLNLSLDRTLTLSGTPIITGSLVRNQGRTLTVSGTPNIAATLTRTGDANLAVAGAPSAAGTLTLERQSVLTVAGSPAFVGTLDLTASGQWTLDGVPLIGGSLIIMAESALTLTGVAGVGGVGMFLKDGTRLHAFILVGGILVPVTPNFMEN